MKILVWGINYAPETTGIAPYNAALCEHLRQAGHEVRMLTSFAYYPEWKKLPQDRRRFYRTDHLNGVPVHRCWHYVPGRVTAVRRILHEATFVLTTFLRAFFLPKPDVMVVVSPPLLLGTAAWLLGKFNGAPFIFHVQDLQPDAAVGLGMLKVGRFTKALYRLEAFAYAKAARVSGISQGMLKAFARKGVPESRRVYFPNGVEPRRDAAPPTGRWRIKQGFAATDFLAVYSGNLGVKQGLEILPEAAALVQDPRVQVVICGDGAARARLQEEIARRSLPNLRLLPLQNAEDYREMMADTDVCVITQQAGTGQFFFPSKLLSALAAAKPVMAVADADSELALAMEEGHFGLCVPPKQAAKLAKTLDQVSGFGKERLQELGEAGRSFGEQFAFDRVFADFDKVLADAARAKVRATPVSPFPHSAPGP